MLSSDLFKYKNKGNGVILIWKNRFVFALGKELYWNKNTEPWEITYTNVGGKVEPNETMLNSTKREVMEELNCKVILFPSNLTLFSNLERANIIEYHLDDEIPPLLIYNSDKMKMSVCVYKAQVIEEPEPHQEVPAILFLRPLNLKGGLLSELIKNGCSLKKQKNFEIPPNIIIRPFGSAELLANFYDKFDKIANFNDFFK